MDAGAVLQVDEKVLHIEEELDDDEEVQLRNQLLAKSKKQTYIPQSDILELVPRKRTGKCFGAAMDIIKYQKARNIRSKTPTEIPLEYNYICNDIWYNLANHISPEDVQRFALICMQSCDFVKSKMFWLKLFRKYCSSSQLDISQIAHCDVATVKQRVVEALFTCYQPLKQRLKNNYKLDTLEGKIYVSSWHANASSVQPCVWVMCYRFKRQSNRNIQSTIIDHNQENTQVVDNWECLADEENANEYFSTTHFDHSSKATTNEGASILVLFCNRFIPFPTEFLCSNSSSVVRLKTVRELLSSDMMTKNLEIDFVSGDQKITWKYNNVILYKVLPWWHPDFREYSKGQC